MGIELTVDQHIKHRQTVLLMEIGGCAVRRTLQTEGDDRVLQPLDGIHGPLVVGVDDDMPRRRHQLGKLVERVLNIIEILEKVQMVRFHIQNHSNRGEKAEKAVAVFAGFQNDGVAVAHPVTGMKQRQRAADHDGGVCLGGHKDVSAHGGGSGFAVGACYAQGIGIVLHNGAPGLGPLVDRDAPGHSAGNLRIAVVDGGGADHELTVPQVIGIEADGHGDTQGAQVADGITFRHIGALDLEPHAPQDLRQRTHGHAADADQVYAFAGNQVFADGIRIVHHRTETSFPNKRPALQRREKHCIIISNLL